MIATLRGRDQFAAFAQAQNIRVGPLSMRVTRSLRPGVPTVGYAIGRSVGGAVVRNRLRRRLRARIGSEAGRLHPNCAYLLSARPGAGKLDADAISLSVSEMVTKAALLQATA